MAKFSLNEYLMGRDKTHKAEYTELIEQTALAFLSDINKLFAELGHVTPAYISSGWRPHSINSKVPGAAKKSLHTLGKAVDIKDPDGSLYKLVTSRPDLMRKYRVWAEHREATPTWLHLDQGERTDRPSRIFKP